MSNALRSVLLDLVYALAPKEETPYIELLRRATIATEAATALIMRAPEGMAMAQDVVVAACKSDLTRKELLDKFELDSFHGQIEMAMHLLLAREDAELPPWEELSLRLRRTCSITLKQREDTTEKQMLDKLPRMTNDMVNAQHGGNSIKAFISVMGDLGVKSEDIESMIQTTAQSILDEILDNGRFVYQPLVPQRIYVPLRDLRKTYDKANADIEAIELQTEVAKSLPAPSETESNEETEPEMVSAKKIEPVSA